MSLVPDLMRVWLLSDGVSLVKTPKQSGSKCPGVVSLVGAMLTQPFDLLSFAGTWFWCQAPRQL